MTIAAHSAHHRAIMPWLYLCMLCVFCMVFIGGVTRLTESGLSIVEWKLMTGIFPPLSEQAWQQELSSYQATPEYQQVNRGMSVSEFKNIYWLEYIHRVLGRITGLVFVIPFLYFALRKQMDKPLTRRMATACVLVAAQGAIGWLMVKSGLQDDPRVSPIRLALHLSMAFFLFCLLTWTVLQLKEVKPFMQRTCGPLKASILIVLLLTTQIIYGAFVAGIDAGRSYNTYPLMDGDFIPSGMAMLEPLHRNMVENIVTVQFQHRIMAIIVSLAIIALLAMRWRHADKTERAHLTLVTGLLCSQFALGVLTLIHVVPITLASSHQMVALLLLACFVALMYRYRINKADIQTNP